MDSEGALESAATDVLSTLVFEGRKEEKSAISIIFAVCARMNAAEHFHFPCLQLPSSFCSSSDSF